jgi:hypothetical protein
MSCRDTTESGEICTEGTRLLRHPSMRAWPFVLCAACVLCASCPQGDDAPTDEPEPQWFVVHEDLPAALLSIWGPHAQDVWAVGGDALDGAGPTVLHFDGETWSRLDTGETQGNLWWVFGFADGPVYFGGDGGMILRYEAGSFTKMPRPAPDRVRDLGRLARRSLGGRRRLGRQRRLRVAPGRRHLGARAQPPGRRQRRCRDLEGRSAPAPTTSGWSAATASPCTGTARP